VGWGRQHAVEEGCVPWRAIEGSETNTPQLVNIFDCESFICAVADCLMQGQSLDFTKNNQAGFRDHIALVLVNGEGGVEMLIVFKNLRM
jgi:hypothetical protein